MRALLRLFASKQIFANRGRIFAFKPNTLCWSTRRFISKAARKHSACRAVRIITQSSEVIDFIGGPLSPTMFSSQSITSSNWVDLPPDPILQNFRNLYKSVLICASNVVVVRGVFDDVCRILAGV